MNRFTFKIIAAMLCICMLLPVFAACGKTEPTPDPTDAQTEGKTDTPTQSGDKPTDKQPDQNTEGENKNPPIDPDEGKVEYTVTVKDQDGNAVTGAMVQICIKDGLCLTPLKVDENGVANMKLEKRDDYQTKIFKAPEGYTYSTDYLDFGDETSVVLTLTLTVECNHVKEIIPAVPATCTEDGSTEGEKCSVCGEITKLQETIDALGHTYTDDTDATCNRCGTERPVYDMVQYYSEIQYISGTGVDGTSTSYGLLSHHGLMGVYPEVSGVTTLGSGNLGLSGFMIVASQNIEKYIWSLDGETWNDCIGGVFNTGSMSDVSNAKKYGDFKNSDRSKKSKFTDIYVDLSEFKDQTAECIYVAARIEGADIIVPICKLENVFVEYIRSPGANMTSYDGYVRHAFDVFSIADNPLSFNVDKYDIHCGEIVRFRGWAGFDKPIARLGYCIGDNGKLVYNTDFAVDAEQGVKDAGGQYAKRFNINIDSTSISNGKHRLYFIAELENGDIIVLFMATVNMSGGFDDDGKPDTDVVKAQPDKSAPANTNAALSGNTVNTGMGASYTFSGGVFSDNRFTFGGSTSHTVSFTGSTKNKLEGEFNRFKIRYVSTEPVKATVTYIENGETVKDVVYLDAAPNGSTFTCLTLKYIETVNAKGFSEIEFASANGQNISFLLCDVDTEIYSVYNNNIKFIQNSKFRLGIKLAWGGGICYIEDRQDGISDLSNLVNQHDTGRLIQQSYYGTNGYDDDYVMGIYNGTPWKYNPVQGGDLYGNHSRIVDVVVEKYSIYIKAQPQDWGHNGDITPSYMENIYTIYPDIIDVWNRFVDYSNYKHIAASQELPAFYTVGYLDTFFHAVDGNPWAVPHCQANLAFWGRRDDKRFTCSYSKTKQTWSAFTNADGTFGLGLYTPNSASILAGRFAYDNDPLNHQAAVGTVVTGCGPTKDSMSVGCSYIAPVNKFKINCYQPVEYSYIMATGSIDQIRTIFQSHEGFANNSSVEHTGW